MVPWEKKSTKYLNIIKREMMMVNIYECSSPIWHWPCIVSTDHVLFHLFILIVWSQCNFGRWGYRETKWTAQHHISNKWWVRNLYPESLTPKLWILKLKDGLVYQVQYGSLFFLIQTQRVAIKENRHFK